MKKQHPISEIRRASVSLVAYETSDPAQTIRQCLQAFNGTLAKTPVIVWDTVRGQSASIFDNEGKAIANVEGKKLCAEIGTDPIQDPVMFLDTLEKIAMNGKAGKAVVFVMNMHRFVQSDGVMQAVWNLRDIFAAVGGTLVMLCPSMKLCPELVNDVLVITEPLPTADEVGMIVDRLASDAGLPIANRSKVVDVLLGVSAFAVEQTFALSLTKDGIDNAALFERKRHMIEQTPGLSVHSGGETFDDIGGCDNVKTFVKRLLTSKNNPVRCIGFIDEIEKMLAGASGDLSGVSQDQLGVLLKEMQDSNIPGIIFIGPPGTAKSAVAKASGSITGAEVLTIDTGAMTGSLVGESQAKIRQAMATFKAVSQGKGMFIATCNKITSLPPELRRRFKLGTFFFDLPSAKERESIWNIWMKKFGFDADTLRPDDDGWTGAEISSCCEIAWRTGLNLIDAAAFIVPVSKSAADSVSALRAMANGRFISASQPGMFQCDEKQLSMNRKVTVTQMTVENQPQTEKE